MRMGEFLVDLTQRMQAVDVISEEAKKQGPDGLPEDGEKVDLPIDLRKMYVVLGLMGDEWNASRDANLERLMKVLRAKTAELSDEDKAFMRETNMRRNYIELVRVLFWRGVRDEFPAAQDGTVALRAGWKVTIKDDEPQVELISIIGPLPGPLSGLFRG